jgi:hypothetical protein
LKKVIKEEKNCIIKSGQKDIQIKLKIWNIIKTNTGKIHASDNVSEIKLYTRNIKDPQERAWGCNKFFLSIVENLSNNHSNPTIAVVLLNKSYFHKIVEIKTVPFTQAEILNIIKSLTYQKLLRL